MEDLDEEWMIQEYSSSSSESEGKMSWILTKVLGLGKKVVITGIVISSAPVVLPPLLVISALGFAFAIPFGLVFASYACTEKLMSKLLGTPTSSSLMLEYETVLYTDEGEEEEENYKLKDERANEDVCIGGVVKESVYTHEEEEEEEEGGGGEKEDVAVGLEVVIEGDEKEQMEDTKRGVEMKIKLDYEGGEELQGDVLQEAIDDSGRKAVENCMQETVDIDESEKEEGCEEDVGEYLEGEDEVPIEGIDVEMGVRGEGEQEPVLKESMVEEESFDEVLPVMVLVKGDEKIEGNAKTCSNVRENEKLVLFARRVVVGTMAEEKVINAEEDEELDRNTTGLLEEIRDAGNNGNIVKEDSYNVEEFIGVVGDEGEKNIRSIQEIEKPSEGEDVKLEKFIEEIKGTDGPKRDEIVPKENEGDKELAKAFGSKNMGPEKIIWDMNSPHDEVLESQKEGNAINLTDEARQAREMEGRIQRSRDAMNGHNIVVVGRPIGDQNGKINGNSLGGEVENIIEEQKLAEDQRIAMLEGRSKDTIAIDAHEDLGLEEEENMINSNADGRGITDENGLDLFGDRNATSENYSYADCKSPEGENADIGKDPILEPKHLEFASKTEVTISPKVLSVENIWEKIDALRVIVGYRAAPQPTCIGEIKSLYVFTGVEPPQSFEDQCDVTEVNEKLRFLMSIVGVK